MPWQETEDGIGSIQFTMAMLAVYSAVFLAELTGTNVAVLQAFPWRVGQGELWRLITSTALHGGILHFAFNVILFYRFSQAIERWLGPWAAMGIYILLALGSSAPQSLFGGMGIGASGVVYGLFGFLWVCRRRYDIAAEVVTPQIVQVMIGWLAICFLLNLFGGNIANTAHLFGLGFGWLLGQVVIATRRLRLPLIAGLLVVWVGLLALTYAPVWNRSLVYVPWVRTHYELVDLDHMYWQEWEGKLGQINPLRVM